MVASLTRYASFHEFELQVVPERVALEPARDADCAMHVWVWPSTMPSEPRGYTLSDGGLDEVFLDAAALCERAEAAWREQQARSPAGDDAPRADGSCVVWRDFRHDGHSRKTRILTCARVDDTRAISVDTRGVVQLWAPS